MSKRVLLIVEGPNDEKVLVEKMWDRFDKNADYKIVTYETNIYVLMKSLFINGDIDEDLDILRLLKSEDIPENKRLDKNERFTDIYLIFDLDPHDPRSNMNMLAKMLMCFNDSSSKGKLYINYPMMQSYRHLTGQNDEDFKNRMVPANIGRKYKSLVDQESWNRLKQINHLDRGLFVWIIKQHLSKMNLIVNGIFEMPTYHAYRLITGEAILEKQCEMIKNYNQIYVLNTSLFLIVDYHPSWFFSDVEPGE